MICSTTINIKIVTLTKIMEKTYTIGEVMVSDVVTASPKESVFDCAKKMRDNKISCLIITHHDEIKGILTEQDISRRVVAENRIPEETIVSDIMSTKITSISPQKDLHEAITLMGTNEIKHLPVVKDKKLVGIITSKDIVVLEPLLIEKLEFNNYTKRQKENPLGL